MLLYSRHWKKYPTAIVDYSTKNTSFIRLASVYRLMGIKNHAFLLALINPKLQGVDPFDPNLTEEQQLMIGIECKINPWYFFREVARVPSVAGAGTGPFLANRANISLIWSFFNHIMYILIQPRQTGKSLTTDMLMALLLNITCENTQFNLLTKDDTLRRANIKRLKDIMDELPIYMQQRSRADSNNGEEITIKSRGNTYLTHVPQSSKKGALKLGRGLTSPIFQVDEPPFQPNIGISLPSALAAGNAARGLAAANNEPYGTILTTTAGKRDDPDGRYIYDMLCDSAIWTEKFFDAIDFEELEQLVRKSSRSGAFRINGTFNHRQLGKSDDWMRKSLEDSLSTGDDANRDFFNVWTAGNQSNPLPIAILERITSSYTEPDYIAISKPYSYITRWFIPESEIEHRLRNGRFVLALDPSEASGGDDIGMYIIDAETLETIGSGIYNETNVINFADWICKVLITYKNITCIVERRSMGAAVLDYLLLMLPAAGIDPFARLYNKIVQDADEFPEKYAEIKQPMHRRSQDIYTRFKKAFGFATSGSGATSRSELYSSVLQLAAKRTCDKIKDKTLIDQINGLVTRNGRVDHEEGKHDDIVIAWLLTHWLLTNGKNLSFYGIDIRKVGNIANEQLKGLTPREIYIMQEQQQIRQRITEIYDELTNEQDDYLTHKLEQELRLLDRRIILESNEIYSVEEVIQKSREEKRKRRQRHAY